MMENPYSHFRVSDCFCFELSRGQLRVMANRELTRVLEQAENLINENHYLEMKEEDIKKKRMTNNEEIRFLSQFSKMRDIR